MSGRPLFALISLVLTAGAALLLFLVLLAGAVDGFPEDQIYFLQADTSAIPGAKPISRWTLWNICGDNNGDNVNCTALAAAFPFDPQSNFPSQTNVPASFIGNNQFYHMSRVVFSFILISLFFSVVSLGLGFFAICTRIGSYLSSAVALLALVTQSVTAAVMTACYVIGRNNFQANGQSASLGNEAFGFIWAAWACLLISTVLYCLAGSVSRGARREHNASFGRKKSTRSRGSFIDAETSSFVRA